MPRAPSQRAPSQRAPAQRAPSQRRRIPDPALWKGKSFFVQIERCSEDADASYRQHSNRLRSCIEDYFGWQIRVAELQVSLTYAFEVRVLPADCHPENGREYVLQEAEALSYTVFSKAHTKRWPTPESILQVIGDFCKVEVEFVMQGREVKFVEPDVLPYEVHKLALNEHCRNSVETLLPLKHFTFALRHVHGQPQDLHTDGEGKVRVRLIPGGYHVKIDDARYDRLRPSSVTVPAVFSPFEIVVSASLKKMCTFFVTDQAAQLFPKFPLLLHRDPPIQTVHLVTRVDGKCQCRLGSGTYVATFDGGTDTPWPIVPLKEEVTVSESELPQTFHLKVQRVRFLVEVILRTRFDDPVAVAFSIKKKGTQEQMCRGNSSELGIMRCDLPLGAFSVKLEPPEDSPYVTTEFSLTVTSDVDYEPRERRVMTKVTEVTMRLVTPDGEPALGCPFFIEQQFPEGVLRGQQRELECVTNLSGTAVVTIGLLEPYSFRVKPHGKAEYMAQQFAFQTDRTEIGITVAKTIFGNIEEEHVVFVVDTSGSMGVYIEDVKAALNLALLHQFYGTSKRFNILTYTGGLHSFREGPVESTRENVEKGMFFCESLVSGGCSRALLALEHSLKKASEADAFYLVTDGKFDVDDRFVNSVRSLYLSNPRRPRVNTVGINCVPQRLTWRGLDAVAVLTQAQFRHVCLQQEGADVMSRPEFLRNISEVRTAPAALGGTLEG